MADKFYGQLNDAAALSDTDYYSVHQGGTEILKITGAQLKAFVGGGGDPTTTIGDFLVRGPSGLGRRTNFNALGYSATVPYSEQAVGAALDSVWGAIATLSSSAVAAPTHYPIGNARSILLGSASLGAFIFAGGFMVSNLSDGTDTFKSIYGIGNNSGDPCPDAVEFTYTHSEYSGHIRCACRSNGSETPADSGVTVVAGTWYLCQFCVNAAGNSVAFYINGSLVATITTNIPVGASRAPTVRLRASRSAGTASRTTNILYPNFGYIL